MLESARYYLKAAELLDAQNLLHVAMVNAAIGMEILLKSFISVPDQHEGTSGETYKLDVEALKTAHQYLQSIGKIPPKQKRDAHDLLTLFHAMPAAIRESLALNSQEHSFERYCDVFTIAMCSPTAGISTSRPAGKVHRRNTAPIPPRQISNIVSHLTKTNQDGHCEMVKVTSQLEMYIRPQGNRWKQI